MSKYILTILSPMILTATTGCGNLFLKMTSGNTPQGAAAFKLDDASVMNDLKGRCGFTLAEASDTSKPLIQLNLKSLPIIVKTSQSDIDAEIALEASASLGSSGGETGTDIDIKIVKISAMSKGVAVTDAAIDKFIRPIANKKIKENKNKSTSVALSSMKTLRQYKEDGQYKDTFCAMGYGLGGKSIGLETGEWSYADGLPGAINPKAALTTYESEIGNERSFKSEVTIKQAKKDWLPVGTVVPVTVTVKKVSTDLSKLDGLPKDMVVPSIKADVAYEITVEGTPGTPIYKFGMTKRMVFFVDSEAKTFSAIATESDQVGEDKSKLPMVVLIPQE